MNVLPQIVQVESGRLWAWVPYGNFETFIGGQLFATSDFVLRRGESTADFRDVILVPYDNNNIAQLQIMDRRGNHLATITHAHAAAHPKEAS